MTTPTNKIQEDKFIEKALSDKAFPKYPYRNRGSDEPQTPTNKIQELIDKTKKGCRNREAYGNPLRFYVCGEDTEVSGTDTQLDWNGKLCDNCQSRLLALQECLEIVQGEGK